MIWSIIYWTMFEIRTSPYEFHIPCELLQLLQTSYIKESSKSSQFFSLLSYVITLVVKEFHEFSTPFAFYRIFLTICAQVPVDISCSKCLKFWLYLWIRPRFTLRDMNMNFSFMKCHYLMHLQFKFEFFKKIQ